ncbi:MAG: hypothetical protein AAGF11_54490 [Myxococcota bacterium]
MIQELVNTHEDPEVVERKSRFIKTTHNIAKDVLTDTCTVWANPPIRKVEGASDEENAELSSLYEELGIDEILQDFHPLSVFLTEATITPTVVDGELELHTLYPYYYDVVTVEGRPRTPIAYAWTTEPTLAAGELIPSGGEIVALDSQKWTYYGSDGKPKEGKPPQEHGLGWIPAATLKLTPSTGSYWAHCGRHRRLADATISASIVSATLDHVRKVQNHKMYVELGETEGKAQIPDPEGGQKVDGSPQDNRVDILDFVTDPLGFITHIDSIYRTIAHAYGGEVAMLARDSKSHQGKIHFPFESLNETRRKHIGACRRFEKALCRAIVGVLTAANHPRAAKLPTVQQIDDGFVVDFGTLSRSFANPSDEMAHYENLKRHGLIHPHDLIRKYYGSHLTEDHCDSILRRNVEGWSTLHTMQADRRESLGATVESDAEQTGRIGGLEHAGNNTSEHEQPHG